MGASRARMETQWAQENLARQLLLEVGALTECEVCDAVLDKRAGDELSEEAIELGMARDTPELEIFESRQDLAGAVRRVLGNSALDCRCAQDRGLEPKVCGSGLLSALTRKSVHAVR